MSSSQVVTPPCQAREKNGLQVYYWPRFLNATLALLQAETCINRSRLANFVAELLTLDFRTRSGVLSTLHWQQWLAHSLEGGKVSRQLQSSVSVRPSTTFQIIGSELVGRGEVRKVKWRRSMMLRRGLSLVFVPRRRFADESLAAQKGCVSRCNAFVGQTRMCNRGSLRMFVAMRCHTRSAQSHQ